MDDDQAARDLDALTAAPEQLDGHTIDELADYLDAGRSPADPSIEGSAACRHALAALERLRAVAPDLLGDPPVDDGAEDAWLAGVLGRISADAHAGADFTVDVTPDGDEIVMTEGALRAVVRAAGDGLDGLLVGRVRFTGDLAAATGPVVVALDVTVRVGLPIPPAVAGLRREVLARLGRHTRLAGASVDITVRDVEEDV